MIKCDDEFRLLQATYNYPWSFDYNHLHSIILEPIYQTLPTFRSSNCTPNPGPQLVPFTSDGRTIFRNFNSSRGEIHRLTQSLDNTNSRAVTTRRFW